jgi:hypothetical protein
VSASSLVAVADRVGRMDVRSDTSIEETLYIKRQETKTRDSDPGLPSRALSSSPSTPNNL